MPPLSAPAPARGNRQPDKGTERECGDRAGQVAQQHPPKARLQVDPQFACRSSPPSAATTSPGGGNWLAENDPVDVTRCQATSSSAGTTSPTSAGGAARIL
jgi:hypothetical protein